MGQGVHRQYHPAAHVRRAMFSVAIVAAIWFALVAPAGAQTDTSGLVQSTAVVDPASCGHFDSQAAAQEALDANPELANTLDADGDGVACDEAFPDVVVDPTSCGHFETYEDAQAAFDDGSVSNPENLDADGDGVVCEDAFGVGDGEQTEDSITCDDFASQAEAQAFFDGDATDLQRTILDVDQDGQACENAFGDDESGPPPARDYTSCGHFESQEDAQQVLDEGQLSNPEVLDGDGDGIACEDAFGTDDEPAAERDAPTGQVSRLPSTGSGPETGETEVRPILLSTLATILIVAALVLRTYLSRSQA